MGKTERGFDGLGLGTCLSEVVNRTGRQGRLPLLGTKLVTDVATSSALL
jgi:hypothetical protein